MEHVGSIIPRTLHARGLYRPTPTEARTDLRRWSRKELADAPKLSAVPWQVVAAETLLAELERRDLEERGLVVTDLAEWEAAS